MKGASHEASDKHIELRWRLLRNSAGQISVVDESRAQRPPQKLLTLGTAFAPRYEGINWPQIFQRLFPCECHAYKQGQRDVCGLRSISTGAISLLFLRGSYHSGVHPSHKWLDTTIRLLECSIKRVRRSITCAPPLHCQWSYMPRRDRRAVAVVAELDAKASVEGTCEPNGRVVWMLKREWHWVSKEKQASWHTRARFEWKKSGLEGEGSCSTYCPFANCVWEYKYP